GHHAAEPARSWEGHLDKGAAALVLVLGLERPSEVFVALVGHHVELVHGGVEDPQAVLIHRETQTAADLLPFLQHATRLIEGADLKDIGVVPALAQGGMAKNEAQGLIYRQETF